MATVAVGTEKGGFLLQQSDGAWQVEGPLFPGWKVTAWGATFDGRLLAAAASNWFGASLHVRERDGEWRQLEGGPRYPEEAGLSLNQVWVLALVEGRLYAGVDQAGLFVSTEGDTWSEVPALNRYPGREQWFPGLGGMCAHRVVGQQGRLWVGISAVGVFRSDDGGSSFVRCDRGVTPTVKAGEDVTADAFCVHSLAVDPARPGLMWRQEHTGVYRSSDGGDQWEPCERGLPAGFGFPILWEPSRGRLLVVPLSADANRIPPDGRLLPYLSDDDGDSWHPSAELDDSPSFEAVLRGAAAVDGVGGVALGTTAGRVFWSSDGGETWTRIPATLPRVLAVSLAA